MSGKRYFGQTKSPAIRIAAHFGGWSGAVAMRDAIRRHGAKIFKTTILATGLTKAEADACERALIRECRSRAPNGYNLTDGGEGCIGRIPGPEAREKMAAAKRGRRIPEVTREKMSATHHERYKDKNLHLKISENTKRALSDPFVRERMSEAQKQRWKARASKDILLAGRSQDAP